MCVALGWCIPLHVCSLACEWWFFSSGLEEQGLRSSPLTSLLLGKQLRAKAVHSPLQRCDEGSIQVSQKADEEGCEEKPPALVLPPA